MQLQFHKIIPFQVKYISSAIFHHTVTSAVLKFHNKLNYKQWWYYDSTTKWKSHTRNIKYSVHFISNPLSFNGTTKVINWYCPFDYKELWCNSLPQTEKTRQTILWIVLHINKWMPNFLDRKLFLNLPASISFLYQKKMSIKLNCQAHYFGFLLLSLL